MGNSITKKIEVPIKGGKLVAYANPDPNYPGIFVDFIAEGDECKIGQPVLLVEEDKDSGLDTNNRHSEENRIRTYLWKEGPESEDYSEEFKWGNANA